MKLRKTLLLCLALTMVLTMALPAMAKTQAEKLQWLIDQKIVEGRNNNGAIDFAYGENLKRSEFAKIVILSDGVKEADVEKAKTLLSMKGFPDVPDSHWANGYIKLSQSKGMIEGYDDGKFYPENFVTYAQVCAMLVRMDSRWSKDKPTNIQWPDTYLNYAKTYGILEGVSSIGANDFVRRDMAFEMLYNHMQTKDSANTYTVTFDYDVVKGIPGYEKNDRNNDYLDIYKNELSVTEVKVAKDKEIKGDQIPMGIAIEQYPTNEHPTTGNKVVTWYLQGWYTKVEGGGDQLKPGTKIKNNVTYYAKWGTEKTLGYVGNFKVDQPASIVAPVGTTFANLYDYGLPKTLKVTFDRNVKVENRDNRDYKITWRSKDYNPDVTGDQVLLGDLDDRTLPEQADYINPVVSITVRRPGAIRTITFDKNGGSGSMSSNEVANGEQYTLPSCSFTAPKTTQEFKAWEINGKEYTPGDKVTVASDLTVKAIWKDKTTTAYVTVTVVDSDANVELFSKKIVKGSNFMNVQQQLMPTPLAGHTFTFSGAPKIIDSDTTVQGKYVADTYTINFKFAVGVTGYTFDHNTIQVEHGKNITVPTVKKDNNPIATEKVTWSPAIPQTATKAGTYQATITE